MISIGRTIWLNFFTPLFAIPEKIKKSQKQKEN